MLWNNWVIWGAIQPRQALCYESFIVLHHIVYMNSEWFSCVMNKKESSRDKCEPRLLSHACTAGQMCQIVGFWKAVRNRKVFGSLTSSSDEANSALKSNNHSSSGSVLRGNIWLLSYLMLHCVPQLVSLQCGWWAGSVQWVSRALFAEKSCLLKLKTMLLRVIGEPKQHSWKLENQNNDLKDTDTLLELREVAHSL